MPPLYSTVLAYLIYSLRGLHGGRRYDGGKKSTDMVQVLNSKLDCRC